MVKNNFEEEYSFLCLSLSLTEFDKINFLDDSQNIIYDCTILHFRYFRAFSFDNSRVIKLFTCSIIIFIIISVLHLLFNHFSGIIVLTLAPRILHDIVYLHRHKGVRFITLLIFRVTVW